MKGAGSDGNSDPALPVITGSYLRKRKVTVIASIKVETTFIRRESILSIGVSLLSGFSLETWPGVQTPGFSI